MKLPLSARRHAFSLALLSASLPPSLLPRRAVLADTSLPVYSPGHTPAELSSALGGLKPGTGRPLNALIKMRAVTGVERLTSGSPLFKPGQVLDQVRSADGSATNIAFEFPKRWILAEGPNIDVRDVKEGDSAFLLAAPLPVSAGGSIEEVPPDFYYSVLFDPKGKYGA
ncbi:MAG: hypothetical protein SGPRY_008884 [Prymnesium sp.]